MDLRRKVFIAAAFTSLLFTLTNAAHAAPGDLDPTFGTSGIALADYGGVYNNGEILAVQPDGKILVCGEAALPGSAAVGVARLNPDGSLDTSFGQGGRILAHLFPRHISNVEDLALQPDGKIVVGGSVDVDPGPAFNYEFWLLRLNPDGSHDLGFGTGGVVTHGLFSSSFDRLAALAIQADGRILAAGGVERTPDEDFQFVVVRYLPDGRLDPDFGTGGKVITDTMYGDSLLRDIALQPDGKIVGAGLSLFREGALVRYDSQGRLDPSFGGDGIVFSTASPSLSGDPQAVVVQPDGKIVAGGIAFPGDFALWRFLPDGSMDPEFGVGGRALTAFPGGHDMIRALALQADGGIVAVGQTHYDQTPLSDFALARYTSDGQLDPDFGNGGTVVTDLDLYDFATDVVSLPDGRLVVTGGVHGPPSKARVLRYLGPELAVNEPPVIAGGAVSPGVLWPANHKMIDVRVSYTVTDDRDPAAAVQCSLSVASNEPVRGTGDGNTAPDWQVVDSHRVFLRAERSGSGNGRTYTITIACTDTAGASSTHKVKVQVPKNRGK
ncbi:MAG TPA: delta-60 repeat domain-containing protein [Thermoanaerobaculia bacterium]|nr:delta-60 repeat domain-containing protein [Thermoanaerobaculia bacterium]